MRSLCALMILLAGCAVVPNSPPPQKPPPVLVLQRPPMPTGARTFALSASFTTEEPTPVYVSPVPTNAPSFGTITPIQDGVVIQWNNWPTNTPYRIEVSTTLTNWKEFAAGVSGDSTVITIMDRSVFDFPAFFYRLMP